VPERRVDWFDLPSLVLAGVLAAAAVAVLAVRGVHGRSPPPESLDPWSGALGILTPAVAFTAAGPARLTAGWWLGCFAVTVVAAGVFAPPWPRLRDASGRRVPERDGRRSLVDAAPVLAVVSLAIAARLVMASVAPLETDEVLPFSTGRPLFDDGHDTWLHPPAFRALQLWWLGVAPDAEGAALSLRALGVVAGSLAVLLLAAAAAAIGRDGRLAAGAVAVIGFGPDVVHDSVLARPYALGLLLASVVLAAMARGGGWATMLVASGLAAWVDVPTGAALGAVCACYVVSHRAPRPAIAALGVLVLWWLPLVPGAIQAAVHPTLEVHASGAADPVVLGQLAERGLGRGEPARLLAELSAITTLGMRGWWLAPVSLGLLVMMARRTTGPGRPIGRAHSGYVGMLVLVIALFFLLGMLRSIRPRNVLVLPALWTLALATAAAGRSRAPRSSR